MSRNKILDDSLNHDVLAFEYVTGVMRGEERAIFESLIKTNQTLATQVHFWEEQLMQLSDPTETSAPAADVWQAIEEKINEHNKKSHSVLESFKLTWIKTSLAFAFILCLGIFSWNFYSTKNLPNVDYVAVLTDANGSSQLTVLTFSKGAGLWLKWDKQKISQNKNLQLWAVSKRDGQARSLGVFTKTQTERLSLTEANWRLIKDADNLILTEEEVGGSPMDEPSATLVAKGACVLLADIRKTI